MADALCPQQRIHPTSTFHHWLDFHRSLGVDFYLDLIALPPFRPSSFSHKSGNSINGRFFRLCLSISVCLCPDTYLVERLVDELNMKEKQSDLETLQQIDLVLLSLTYTLSRSLVFKPTQEFIQL